MWRFAKISNLSIYSIFQLKLLVSSTNCILSAIKFPERCVCVILLRKCKLIAILQVMSSYLKNKTFKFQSIQDKHYFPSVSITLFCDCINFKILLLLKLPKLHSSPAIVMNFPIGPCEFELTGVVCFI